MEDQCARSFKSNIDLICVKTVCLYGDDYTSEEKYDEKKYIFNVL